MVNEAYNTIHAQGTIIHQKCQDSVSHPKVNQQYEYVYMKIRSPAINVRKLDEKTSINSN